MNVHDEMEKTYPEMMNEFKRIQLDQYDTFCKKMHDYGTDNISMGMDLYIPDNVTFATTGIIIRINDKIQRLINLVIKKKSNPQNEPIIDAFKDTSVYCIIAQIIACNKWGK